MDKGFTLLSGAGLGAGLMYLFDADRGRRRRALLRDQVASVATQAGNAIPPTTRDLSNRARGLVAETAALLSRREVPDEVLVARLRSRMGRYVSHPGSIEITADQGHVTLRGPILAHEVEGLMAAVAGARGVTSVENQLEVHKQPGNVPGLQGGVPRPGERFELMQENWSPTARLAMGTAGSLLTVYGTNRRGLLGTFLSGMGLGMLTRAITNLQLKRLLGIGSGRRAIDIQKTINVSAPVEQVYAFWNNLENFPRFMSHVREVKDQGNDRYHWVVDGPAGVPVHWNAVVTRRVPNEMVAWRSEEGATVGNAGVVHFTPNAQGGTQVHVRFSYNPPVGAIGHTVATFFGSDPKTAMDEDLVRFKSLVEEGKTTADGQTVTSDQVETPAAHRM